jgi:archaellum component FlaC
MDAIHYDKIADKLIQFHSKLPDTADLELYDAKSTVEGMKIMIEKMLKLVDDMANRDEKGWLR